MEYKSHIQNQGRRRGPPRREAGQDSGVYETERGRMTHTYENAVETHYLVH